MFCFIQTIVLHQDYPINARTTCGDWVNAVEMFAGSQHIREEPIV
jgi:hypothetical protein